MEKPHREETIDPKADEVPDEDSVKCFPMCEKCAGTVEIIRQGEFTDPDHEYYIYRNADLGKYYIKIISN